MGGAPDSRSSEASTPTTAADLVDALLQARDRRRTTQPPTLRMSRFDLGKAYRVGAALDRRLVERGYRRAGWKVGFTNRSIWPRFGLTQPILAPVYDRTVRMAGMADPVAALSLTPFRVPRIEVEVVFGIEQQRDGAMNWSRPGWMALGFEIVDCHYPGWHLTPADSVADFGLHGALVVGPRVDRGTPRFDQRIRALSQLEVQLLRNGKPTARGHASDVLGSPLAALQTVPGLMQHFGSAGPGSSGIVVSTGTMTDLAPLAPGERWRAEVAGGVDLPGLEVKLEM